MSKDAPAIVTNRLMRAQLARQSLVAFLFTFTSARVLVFLIVAQWIPDIYLRLGGTHVHHLNYGIFLLSGVGGYLLLGQPDARGVRHAATAYGIGLALTFDEFGLWLHLGGSYWQRASFDAVVVVAAVLALVALIPALGHVRPHGWATSAALAVAVTIFGVGLVKSFDYADRLLLRVQVIEQARTPP